MKNNANHASTLKLTALAIALCAALTACDRQSTDTAQAPQNNATAPSQTATAPSTTPPATSAAPTTTGSTNQASSTAAPSNTASSDTAQSTNAQSASTDGSRTAGAMVDDGVITTKVKAALLADDTVKGTDISVETLKGEVMLSGFVESKTQQDRAVKIASGVNGVNKVNDKLSVRSGAK